MPFYDDFDNGFDNWLISGQDWGADTLTFRSPPNSITDSPDGNYPVYSNATLRLAHPIDLSSSSAPVLSFWHQYYVTQNSDYCYVEVSEDGGFVWIEEASYTGYTTTLSPETIDLSAYTTSPILIRFRLWDNGDGNYYNGWHIDDVEITGPNSVHVFQSSNPREYCLNQNYPNPFNPSTKISWQSSIGSWQTLKVYDLSLIHI